MKSQPQQTKLDFSETFIDSNSVDGSSTDFGTNNNLDLGKYLINISLANNLKCGNNISKNDKKNILKESFHVVIFNKL